MKKILLVEDDPFLVDIYSQKLKKSNLFNAAVKIMVKCMFRNEKNLESGKLIVYPEILFSFFNAVGNRDLKNKEEKILLLKSQLMIRDMLFNYDKKIKPDTLLDFKINFPTSRIPIDCVGKVLRIEESRHMPIFRIAVVFVAIEEGQKEIINSAAEEIYLKTD